MHRDVHILYTCYCCEEDACPECYTGNCPLALFPGYFRWACCSLWRLCAHVTEAVVQMWVLFVCRLKSVVVEREGQLGQGGREEEEGEERDEQSGECIASFPGLPTIQFLITCSMQERWGKAWYHLSHEWHQCRQKGEGSLVKRTS